VVTALKSKLARGLGVEAKAIEGGKGLADYGMDSLMAVELRNWTRRDFGVSVAVFDIMQDGKRIDDIGVSMKKRREMGQHSRYDLSWWLSGNREHKSTFS